MSFYRGMSQKTSEPQHTATQFICTNHATTLFIYACDTIHLYVQAKPIKKFQVFSHWKFINGVDNSVN